MRPNTVLAVTTVRRARATARRSRIWATLLVLSIVVVTGVGCYGASTWLVLQQQTARIGQQYAVWQQLNTRQQHARATARTLSKAVGELPDAAGTAFTDHDRHLLRADQDALRTAIAADTPVTLQPAATIDGSRIGDWHDAALRTMHRANANHATLTEQQHQIARLTSALDVLDGALAHTSATIRTQLPGTLAALPGRSPTALAAIRSAAAATHGPTPTDRAHHLWAYLHTLQAAN